MILNRKLSLFLLLSNLLLLLYTVGVMIYLHQDIIDNTNKFPFLRPSTWAILQSVVDVLLLIIFAGCIKILIVTHQRNFIIITSALFMLLQLGNDVLGILGSFRIIDVFNPFIDQAEILKYVALAGFMIVVCFIKTASIKRFFVAFAALLITAYGLTWLTRYLFGLFEIEWILINPTILNMLPYLATLALYYKLYRSSTLQVAQ